MASRDDRPFYALAALLALIALAFLAPASRAWLVDSVVDPLRSQADPGSTASQGYSFESLLVWALAGGVLAWVAYELVFVRKHFEPDRDFFLALAPALLFGPLLHAALVAGALAEGSVVAYLAAEPLVYLTAAAVAGIGLALARFSRSPVLAPLLWGALVLAPVLVAMLPRLTLDGARLAGILLALALGSAYFLTETWQRLRPGDPALAVFAVIAAHALDGATTWMVLRDPFGLGFEGFAERNPVSQLLVDIGNGWPYFALKLVLPLALLAMLKREEHEARLRAFILFAIFVLGFGPGMSNLLQVAFG